MLFVYPAIFHKEDDAYWVEFPDLPGCQTFGQSLNETMEYAQEALGGYLLTLFEDGLPLAEPSDLSVIEFDSDSFVTLVTCNINPVSYTHLLDCRIVRGRLHLCAESQFVTKAFSTD